MIGQSSRSIHRRTLRLALLAGRDPLACARSAGATARTVRTIVPVPKRLPETSLYSPKLAQDIGYVVLEASSAEDALGELLVLRKGLTVPDPQWWQSGETLVKAVEGLADPDLQVIVDELRRILPLRHHVVHGLWLEGEGQHLTMLRAKSTKKDPKEPSFGLGQGWSDETLTDLAERFRHVARLASDAITRAMGLP